MKRELQDILVCLLNEESELLAVANSRRKIQRQHSKRDVTHQKILFHLFAILKIHSLK